MKPYKAVAVSYLNTKPLLFGIYQEKLDKEIDIELANPADCAAMLRSGEVDMGLVPVGILPFLGEYHLVSDYCIGAERLVRTVSIFSECPLEEIGTLYLDYQSRTSVALVQLLLRHYWKLSPVLVPAMPGFESLIGGSTAALVIGDRTIPMLSAYPYVYDLAEAWYDWQGLPFVFAVWVSKKQIPQAFIQQFNKAMQEGIDRIPALVKILPNPGFDFDLADYFTSCISYQLDADKRKALSLFLDYLRREMPQMVIGS